MVYQIGKDVLLSESGDKLSGIGHNLTPGQGKNPDYSIGIFIACYSVMNNLSRAVSLSWKTFSSGAPL